MASHVKEQSDAAITSILRKKDRFTSFAMTNQHFFKDLRSGALKNYLNSASMLLALRQEFHNFKALLNCRFRLSNKIILKKFRRMKKYNNANFTCRETKGQIYLAR